MAALDATVGGPLANSYITIAQANNYMEERLYTEAWYAPAANREAALITATRLIEEQMLWLGERATTTQALDWPRSGLTYANGVPIDPLSIPVQVQRATAYYALALLQDTSQTTTTVAAGTVKRQQIGDTSVEFFDPGAARQQVTTSPWTTMPAEMRQMLRPFGSVLGLLNIPVLRT